jgi:septum formation topological specificity factor MinE
MGSISTFGIKTQLSNQNNKAQQQSRFNIILANKKHNLQRKYMELIREKD